MTIRVHTHLIAVLVALAGSAGAAAQSSTSYRLLAGEIAAAGGAAQSASYRLVESAVSGISLAEASSTGYRLNGGILLTGVAGSEQEGVPRSLELYQNFPNPFNPSTTIAYALPVRSPVRIVVSSALGQAVRTLEQGEQDPGSHRVVWDGTNDRGESVSSGVYVCRLQAGAAQLTRLMILLR